MVYHFVATVGYTYESATADSLESFLPYLYESLVTGFDEIVIDRESGRIRHRATIKGNAALLGAIAFIERNDSRAITARMTHKELESFILAKLRVAQIG